MGFDELRRGHDITVQKYENWGSGLVSSCVAHRGCRGTTIRHLDDSRSAHGSEWPVAAGGPRHDGNHFETGLGNRLLAKAGQNKW
jgi:hypothetical protein